MSVTREELAAFADGQLDEPRRSEVAAEVAADPALATELGRHRALKQRLAAHFAPILGQPVPTGLSALLGGPEAKVVDFTAARQHRAARGFPRWGWIVGPALAASLALAVFLPQRTPEGYADPRLAAALDDQLVASQREGAPTRILLSFRKRGGQYCRAFSGAAHSGIACKDGTGWRVEAGAGGAAPEHGGYKMAGSPAAAIMAQAQDMAAGPALTADQEATARARGWR
ncbi:MAG TPA: anti-sigma factor [Croceibacterium sp.]|jgi:anti-sigma factor RsiW